MTDILTLKGWLVLVCILLVVGGVLGFLAYRAIIKKLNKLAVDNGALARLIKGG